MKNFTRDLMSFSIFLGGIVQWFFFFVYLLIFFVDLCVCVCVCFTGI